MSNRITEVRRGRGSGTIVDKENQLPYYSPSAIIKAYLKYLGGDDIHSRKHRDLVLMDLVDEDDFAIDIEGFELHKYLGIVAFGFNKLKKAHDYFGSNTSAKTKDLIEDLPELFEGLKTLTSKMQVGSIVLSWAWLMYAVENDLEFKSSQSRRIKGDLYYLSASPKHALNTIIELDRNRLEYTPNNKRKIGDLIYLGIVHEDNWQLTNLGLSILNSRNPEKELSKVALQDTGILAFIDAVINFSDSPRKKLMKINYESIFFSGMGKGSFNTRTSVYKNWIHLIIEENKI